MLKKHLACTAALFLPLLMAAPAGAQPASSTAPPAAAAEAPATTAPDVSGTATASDLSKADKRFVTTAAHGGIAEVQMAQLAQQKSQDATVKQFAQTMIDDHTPNNQQLVQLATSKGLTPPTEPDASQQKTIAKLQGLDGAAFDKAYMAAQIKGHTAMLKAFQIEAKGGKDADLKAFAAQTTPVIQKHLRMARADKNAA